MDAATGDRFVIEANRVGQARRTGEVIAVLGASPRQQFRVRWDDGHESIYIPSSGCTVEHKRRRT
jgi:hypothetical protein